MRALNTGIERIVEVTSYALGVLLIVVAFINVANVISRYIFRRPFVWGEEIILYIIIWLVFIGVPVVAWRGLHLRMEVVYNVFPSPLKRVVAILIGVVTIWLCSELIGLAWRVITLLQTNNQRSAAAGVPMFLVYWAMPIGFALLAAVSFVQVVGYITGRRRVEEERTLAEEEIEQL